MMIPWPISGRSFSGCLAALSYIGSNVLSRMMPHRVCRPASVQTMVGTMHMARQPNKQVIARHSPKDMSNGSRKLRPWGERTNACIFRLSSSSLMRIRSGINVDLLGQLQHAPAERRTGHDRLGVATHLVLEVRRGQRQPSGKKSYAAAD